jgi:hypothetical protein
MLHRPAVCLGAALLAGVIALPAPAARAQEAAPANAAGLTIELNKLEQTEQGCRPVFLFANRTGHGLNRLQLDLVLFDPAGIYRQQVLLDMAPMPDDKQMLASFLLDSFACDEIGRILVNNVPQCQDGAGAAIDCLPLLHVTSKSAVPLEK